MPADAPREHLLQMFRAIDGNVHDELPSFFSNDVVYERPGYPPIEGLDALLHFYRSERVIASGRHHITHLIGDGTLCCAAGHFTGVLKNGRPADLRFCDLYQLSEGRISNRTTYFYVPCV